MRDCADLRRDKHLSVAHMPRHGHLRCGDLSGFGNLQGFPDLPRLRNLSRDPDMRQHGDVSECQFLSGHAHMRRYDHLLRIGGGNLRWRADV